MEENRSWISKKDQFRLPKVTVAR